MACYSHKRATVLSKGPFRVVCRNTFQIFDICKYFSKILCNWGVGAPPKKKHTKGSREGFAFGCFIRDGRDYLATIAYVTVGCRVLITGDRVTAADASCSGTAVMECTGTCSLHYRSSHEVDRRNSRLIINLFHI